MAPHAVKKRKLDDHLHGRDETDARFSKLEKSRVATDRSSPTEDAPESEATEDDDAVGLWQKKSSDGHIKKQPHAEQARLSLTSSYNSSIFNLQLDELLTEVQPNYEKRMPPVDAALRKLKAILERVPQRSELSVCAPPIPPQRVMRERYN